MGPWGKLVSNLCVLSLAKMEGWISFNIPICVCFFHFLCFFLWSLSPYYWVGNVWRSRKYCVVLYTSFEVFVFIVICLQDFNVWQAMQRCSQPIPCSAFNNDGSIFAYAVRSIFCFFTNHTSLLLYSYFFSLYFSWPSTWIMWWNKANFY